MIGSAAIARIQQGLGFSTRQSAIILDRLKEAQRDLEKGKTLPKFLLQEDEALVLASGTHATALPAGFLRVDDDNLPFFIDSVTSKPKRISIVRSYTAAVEAYYTTEAEAPRAAVIRASTIDFINTVSQTYNLVWSYYKAAALVTEGAENAWLANAPEWLIGEAGWRIAMDNSNADAVGKFEALRKHGRAACFGEILASEDAAGPIAMGENL